MARTALWTDIAATLREGIAAGQYGPGAKLPTEAEFAARFGVNRHTVRRALADLAEAGLVRSRRGAGVFVAAAPPVDYPLGRRTRFRQNLAAAGRIAGREILSLESRAADEREAQALSLAPGDGVTVCEGVSLADGAPLAMFRSVFPAARFPDLIETLRRETSITRALAACGLADYTRAETRMTAMIATPTQALRLDIREGDPILRTVAINVDAAGQPVEFGETWFAGDRVTLTVTPEDGTSS